jgi:inositol-hexakisphosphate kinase
MRVCVITSIGSGGLIGLGALPRLTSLPPFFFHSAHLISFFLFLFSFLHPPTLHGSALCPTLPLQPFVPLGRPMTSIYHTPNSTSPATYSGNIINSPYISPPHSSSSFPKSLRPGRPISDVSPFEPLPIPSPSPNIHHIESDVDRADSEATSSDANPSATPSRSRVSPRESAPRSQPIPVIQSARPDLAFPTSPHRTPRPLSRRPSTPSTASSSDSSPPPSSYSRTSQYNAAGIGRKVADSLQLFKESVSLPTTEVINPLAFARACSPSRRRLSTRVPADDDDDVISPHFEFVKRADWQEREAAALRRERGSAVALDRPRVRESAVAAREHRASASHRKERPDPPKGGVLDDRAHFNNDSAKQKDSRGRPRDRQRLEKPSVVLSPNTPAPAHAPYNDLCLTPIVTSPHSYALSLTRSSREHVPVPPSQRQPSSDFAPPVTLSSTPVAKHAHASEISHSRSPTPVRTVPQSPPRTPFRDPVSPPSPWTTDDESAWESASVSSSSSTSSPPSPPEPIESNPDVTWSVDDDYHGITRHTTMDHDVGVDDHYGAPFDLTEDALPHIPLRPFRNQVGGHSSIYKFTKRAVCKVRTVLMSYTTDVHVYHEAPRFKGEFVLRGR